MTEIVTIGGERFYGDKPLPTQVVNEVEAWKKYKSGNGFITLWNGYDNTTKYILIDNIISVE